MYILDQYGYTELKNKPKNKLFKGLELVKGRIFK